MTLDFHLNYSFGADVLLLVAMVQFDLNFSQLLHWSMHLDVALGAQHGHNQAPLRSTLPTISRRLCCFRDGNVADAT